MNRRRTKRQLLVGLTVIVAAGMHSACSPDYGIRTKQGTEVPEITWQMAAREEKIIVTGLVEELVVHDFPDDEQLPEEVYVEVDGPQYVALRTDGQTVRVTAYRIVSQQ